MSADITPSKARQATDELLTQLRNQYSSDSGAHLVVTNEINRRAEIKKNWRKIGIALVVGCIGLAFWWLRG